MKNKDKCILLTLIMQTKSGLAEATKQTSEYTIFRSADCMLLSTKMSKEDSIQRITAQSLEHQLRFKRHCISMKTLTILSKLEEVSSISICNKNNQSLTFIKVHHQCKLLLTVVNLEISYQVRNLKVKTHHFQPEKQGNTTYSGPITVNSAVCHQSN